jgi:glycosyltransferase involved in cell wall biosynthesis
MRKKRILFCSEATFLNTGYATYTREILNYLNSTNKYIIAELAAYGTPEDPRASQIPWKYYPAALPNDASEEERRHFSSQPTNQFGEYFFEKTCLEFLPDIVCDIRDFWMMDFVERSPFRKYFKWCIMPTVDAAPQARQWIATYQSADACLSYSDWSGEVLKKQSGEKIKYIGSAPPSAHSAYFPVENKDELRSTFGLNPDDKIVGTVMRNQRRKLYPDLFKAFRILLEKTNDDPSIKLYCHTSYPDMGWDIPELLQQYNLSSRVYFTYVCPETKKPFASFFAGAIAQSPFTGKFNSHLSNVKQGLSYEDLSKVINLFDIYVQYANSEGFGLPQVEAAACAVPVMSTDYSAMETVVRKLGGYPIKPRALYKEMETGCMRAVPDNEEAAIQLKAFLEQPKSIRRKIGFDARQNFLKHFQWDQSGKMWEDYFDSVELIAPSQSWMSPPDIATPAPQDSIDISKITHQGLATWLIGEVLHQPSKINSYMMSRLVRDLMYQTSTQTVGGMYLNESSAAFDNNAGRVPFNFEIAYQKMKQLRDRINFWEQKRMEIMQR